MLVIHMILKKGWIITIPGRLFQLKNKGPWDCVYSESFETKLDANRRELDIKRMKSRKYIEYLIK